MPQAIRGISFYETNKDGTLVTFVRDTAEPALLKPAPLQVPSWPPSRTCTMTAAIRATRLVPLSSPSHRFHPSAFPPAPAPPDLVCS